MVTVSGPSSLGATAIPSISAASVPSSAASESQAKGAPGGFHQTYKDAEAETAPAPQAPSGRDSGVTNKKASSGKDKSRTRKDDSAAAVTPAPISTAQGGARLALSPSLGPKGDFTTTDTHEAAPDKNSGQDEGSGQDKSSGAANDSKPRAIPSALFTAVPSFIESPVGAAGTSQPDTSQQDSSQPDSSQPGTSRKEASTPRMAASTDRPAPQASFTPRMEPLAFSIHLRNNEAQPAQTSAGARHTQTETPANEAATRDIRPASAPGVTTHSGRDSAQDDSAQDKNTSSSAPANPATLATAREIAVESPSHDVAPVASSRAATATTAPRVVESLTPQTPGANSNSSILLRISGPDQSSASVRVVDRGGAVNVQVHASDPELRDSLRTNLGDLASQLGSHGWKTDAMKPATATHSDNNTDSQPNGQRSFNQRDQAAPGDRQSQRDRRSSADRWVDEFEQHTSSPAANRGGKS